MADNDDLSFAKKKIQLARIDESEICPIVQTLSLQEEQDDICLLQLNPAISAHILEGKTLTIRGEAGDPAVICTKNATYEMKEAETSNSLLLLPDMLWSENCNNSELKVVPKNVSGIFHNYYELRIYKPSFKKLRSNLERNAYRGREYEDSEVKDYYSFDKLLDTIQASEEELKDELKCMQACPINGYIRVLDFDYKFNLFSSIISVIESQSFPLEKIPKDVVIEALKDLESVDVIDNCFSWYTCDMGNIDENGCKLYSLLEDPVCQMYAEVLLRSSGKFHLQDFLESWQRSVPEGMKCDLLQLRGLALTDTSGSPEVIFHFPAHNLSENIRERFEHLFSVKEKWSYEEIVPYLEDRATATINVKALLIKNTRESTRDGKKYYSSKW